VGPARAIVTGAAPVVAAKEEAIATIEQASVQQDSIEGIASLPSNATEGRYPADSSANAPAAKAASASKTAKKKHSNTFSFTLSAGPDVSSVGMNNFGKVKLASGAGVTYHIGNRWGLRTGFYSASKVYEAAPDDYKPADPVMYRNYLKSISADCRVYEIPVLVNYEFGKSDRQKTFISAGLSSLIMKKENYLYWYKYPNGSTYTYAHNEKNKYRHFFSVLSLSAGYQRRISRTVSLVAEPYLKMPLAGVGYGKIKLNSAGILFSVNFNPFVKTGK
jgi:hypothetical protein